MNLGRQVLNAVCCSVFLGNVHGKYKHPPVLDFERMAEIRKATIQAAQADGSNTPPCLLVLHGASGLSEEIIAEVRKSVGFIVIIEVLLVTLVLGSV